MNCCKHQTSGSLWGIVVVALLLLVGCSEPMPGSGAGGSVNVNIATPPVGVAQTNVPLSGVLLSSAYPFLSAVTMEIFAEGHTTASINREYNSSRFSMVAGRDAFYLVDSNFTLNVPNDVDVSFFITAYSRNGYQIFTASALVTSAEFASGPASLPVSMQVDIDPLVPILASVSGCVDSDGDDLCDLFEDMFVRLDGIADVDGDGLLNRDDPDSDNDGLPDAVDGLAPSNDGYPSFIHANKPPTSVALALITDKGAEVVGNALVEDPDVGDCHSIAITAQPANGTATVSTGGANVNPYECMVYSVAYLPNPGFTGDDLFRITATDRAGKSVSNDVSVSVQDTGINLPPLANNQTLTVAEDGLLPITLSGSDPEGLAVGYTLLTLPTHGSLSGTAPALSYTPTANYNGSDAFTFIVNDGLDDSAIAQVDITVTPVNDAPLAVNDSAATAEDIPITTGNVLSNDSDIDLDSLRVSAFDLISANGGAITDNGDGSFDYAPPLNFNGSDSFGYTVSDGTLSASATVTISISAVNDAPVGANDSDTTSEDTSFTTINVLTNDIDVDLDTLGISGADSSSANGALITNNGDGTFVYAPPLNFNGADTFNYTVSDAKGGTASATVTINVTPLNDAPVARDDGARTLLRASLGSAGAEVASASVCSSLNANGRFVAFWSADPNLVINDKNGVYDLYLRDTLTDVTVRATVDSAGLEADAGETDPAQLSPAVISDDSRYVIFASRATNLGSQNTGPTYYKELYEYDRLEGVTTPLLGCEGWPDGDSYESVATPDFSTYAFTSLSTDPWPGCWSVSDANGVSDIYLYSNTLFRKRVSEDVAGTEGNGASFNPTISDDGLLVAFASSATNLLFGATDSNGVDDIYLKNLTDGGVTRISVDSAGNEVTGGHSSAPSMSSDGKRIAFASNATNLVAGDSNGVADIFVRDTAAGATLRVSVDSAGVEANGVSSAPRISKDGRFVVFESLANNLVPDDSNGVADIFVHDMVTGQTRRLSDDTQGTEGNGAAVAASISSDGRHVVYTSAANNLVASDNNAAEDIFHTTLTDITTVALQAVTTPNLLLNDNDVDGDPFSISSNSLPSNGSLLDNLNNTFSYTPNSGVVGVDAFSYTIADGAGGAASAWVWVASEGANYPPNAVSDTATTLLSGNVVITVTGNDFDLDGDILSVSGFTQPTAGYGTVTDSGGGTLTYTAPTTAPYGPPFTAWFTYDVDDGSGITSSAQVSVTVNP